MNAIRMETFRSNRHAVNTLSYFLSNIINKFYGLFTTPLKSVAWPFKTRHYISLYAEKLARTPAR